MSSKRVVYTAKTTEIKHHTEFIREYIFQMDPPQIFKFRAGQFLMLHLEPPQPGEKDILRAYSLASGEQSTSHFRLLIKYIKDGIASQFFWSLQEGSPIRFTGPFGKLFFPEPPSSHLYFLSTGSGLAPHISYVETFIEQFPQCHYHFLIGVRTQNDFFYTNYLNELSQKYPQFKYEFVLSRPDPSWTGKTGYLQQQLPNLEIDIHNSHVFVCGNEDMAKQTKNVLLEMGLPKEKALVEIF